MLIFNGQRNGLHDNSNSDNSSSENSNSFKHFQGAISQKIIWNWKKKTCQPEEINKDYDVQKIKLKDIMKDRKFRMILTIFEPYRITWWYFTKQNIN